jgi:hypothetical protein
MRQVFAVAARPARKMEKRMRAETVSIAAHAADEQPALLWGLPGRVWGLFGEVTTVSMGKPGKEDAAKEDGKDEPDASETGPIRLARGEDAQFLRGPVFSDFLGLGAEADIIAKPDLARFAKPLVYSNVGLRPDSLELSLVDRKMFKFSDHDLGVPMSYEMDITRKELASNRAKCGVKKDASKDTSRFIKVQGMKNPFVAYDSDNAEIPLPPS